MRKISDSDLKIIQFNILRNFKAVCDLINVNYSLIGGTLLGAVRHKGFIPWDDDIDVCMTRDDYRIFEDYCLSNKTDFVFLSNETEPNYGYLFAKLFDPNTIQNEFVGNRKQIEIGVHIDLFIYDAMADTYKDSIKTYNKSKILRELLIAANWKKYSKSKTHKWYYEPARLMLFVFSRFISYRKTIRIIEKMYINNSFSSKKYVANLSSDKRTKSIIESSCFEKYIELVFEGEKFKVFDRYEVYLNNMYGDYMTPPPENKRITHHSFEAFYKDN